MRSSKTSTLTLSQGSIVTGTEFPYFQYTSLLGTQTLLLGFTALFLPRSTLLITSLPPQQSSLDKPQHPFLEPITASPVFTLLWLCAGTSVCQAWWAGWMRQWWSTKPRSGTSSDGEKNPGPAAAIAHAGIGKIEALRNAWANALFASIVLHIVAVLFGAPIASHIPHTYLLSLLVSILVVFVPAYTLPLSLFTFKCHAKDMKDLRWVPLFVERKLEFPIERALVFPVVGAFLGCWAGISPIPLDWDRPWQAWPLTPAYGALAGHLLGSWLSLAINVTLFLANQDRLQASAVEKVTVGTKKRGKKKSE